MKRIALIAAVLATPVAAQDYVAVNSLTVAQVTPHVFEVTSRPGTGTQDFWCAAGDYARAQLGARVVTRIYVAEPRQPSTRAPGRSAVRFTLDPAAAGVAPIDPPYSLSVSLVGDNLSASLAQQYCLRDIEKF